MAISPAGRDPSGGQKVRVNNDDTDALFAAEVQCFSHGILGSNRRRISGLKLGSPFPSVSGFGSSSPPTPAIQSVLRRPTCECAIRRPSGWPASRVLFGRRQLLETEPQNGGDDARAKQHALTMLSCWHRNFHPLPAPELTDESPFTAWLRRGDNGHRVIFLDLPLYAPRDRRATIISQSRRNFARPRSILERSAEKCDGGDPARIN